MSFRLRADAESILFYASQEELTVTQMAPKIAKSFDATYAVVAILRSLGYIQNNSLKSSKTGFIKVSETGMEYLRKVGLL